MAASVGRVAGSSAIIDLRGARPLWVAMAIAGVVAAARIPALPTWPVLLTLAVFGLLAFLRPGARRAVAIPGLAAIWFLGHALHGMQSRLPDALDGRDVVLTFEVRGLARHADGASRFEARVLGVDADPAVRDALVGQRVRLVAFDVPDVAYPSTSDPVDSTAARGPENEALRFAPGSRWRALTRIRRPRGLVNPGGFDTERYALEHALSATGWLKAQPSEVGGARPGIDSWRDRLAGRIERALGSERRAVYVKALAIADTRGLQESDWRLLRVTGITHLVAISGLHVGLVAGFGAWLAMGLYWLFPRLGLALPRPIGAGLAALLFAVFYTAMAGFALPTVRTCLMIAVIVLARSSRRALSIWHSLALAAAAVLVFDPLALIGASFWLSFAGVAWLIACLPQPAGWRAWLRTFVTAQAVMLVALAPLAIAFFGETSTVGGAVNLVAVPWVSFVVVPLALVGTVLTEISANLATPVLAAAANSMDWLLAALQPVADWPAAHVRLTDAAPLAVASALLGAVVVLLPRATPLRVLGLVLLLPLFVPYQKALTTGDVRVEMIDVGQGLAVLVQTRHHALLYDTGPAVPERYDAGERVVVPVLDALRVSRLDRIIVSHGDLDHAGGLGAVRAAWPNADVLTSAARIDDAQPCERGQSWQWDGVSFEILHPPRFHPERGNDTSCVLRISGPGGAVLLTGDISGVVEERLQREQAEALQAAVVAVAHHGSHSASSATFVGATNADIALNSSGYHNRFGHPVAAVVARWQDSGSEVFDTGRHGAISVELPVGGLRSVHARRQRFRRLWND